MSVRILDHIFRRKLLLILPIILGGILGVLWAIATYETHYESRVSIWVERPAEITGAGISLTDFNPYLSPAANQTNSIREIMGSNSFMAGVAKRVDGTVGNPYRYAELRAKTVVFQYGDHLMYILYASSIPEETAKVAQAIIDEYSAVFAKQVKDQAGLAATFYKEQLELTRAEYEKATAELNAFLRARPQLAATANQGRAPGSVAITDPELSKLVISQENAETQYDAMWSRFASSQMAATSSDATSAYFAVMDPPEVPTVPIVPRKKSLAVKPISGVMLGSLVAVLLFLVSWRMDRKIRFATDFAFVGDVVVVTLPVLRARRQRWPASFVRMAAAIQSGVRDLSTRSQLGPEGIGREGA